MCGICGIINFNEKPIIANDIITMMKKIKHRGPDDEGNYIIGNIGLGFVRLSILDLSMLGHQPMLDESNNYVIVYNGEIYNYIEIREELKSMGYFFKSNSDTEVILKSYIEWGTDSLHKFNGMWAFCIYDKKKNKLVFSRDRFGIKPFYYCVNVNRFVFASEISAILSVLGEKPKPNNQAIFDYVSFNRTDHNETTFFDGIKKLQHGHCLEVDLSTGAKAKEFKLFRWYKLDKMVANSAPFESSKEYKELLCSSIGLRLRSDVPIGVCLSGGIDSSSITSILVNEFGKKDLNTFSAVYGNGHPSDESYYINMFNNSVNLFLTYPDGITLFNEMQKFINTHSEPLPSTSPYAQYKVMELAQKNVVVTLDGQGADEQLAGYHYFYGHLYKDLLKQVKLFKLFNEILAYLTTHKSTYALKTFIYFLLPIKLKTLISINERGYLLEAFANNYSDNSSLSSNLYDSPTLNTALIDHFEYKLEHLLKWSDRNSMRHSIESRVPFLDFRLVEKTLASPNNIKIEKAWTKTILREAMEGILHEEIRLRKDKIGFSTPENEWFRTDVFSKFIYQLLNSESFQSRKIIDPVKAKILYKKHLNNEINISKDIWKWINLELWFQQFID